MSRRQFTKEFKAAAVRRLELGASVAEEALPIDSRCTGLSPIAVNDDNALRGPAQGNSVLAQSVLRLGAFGVFENLAKRGLADVKIGVPLQVTNVHFLVCDACHGVTWLRENHAGQQGGDLRAHVGGNHFMDTGRRAGGRCNIAGAF